MRTLLVWLALIIPSVALAEVPYRTGNVAIDENFSWVNTQIKKVTAVASSVSTTALTEVNSNAYQFTGDGTATSPLTLNPSSVTLQGHIVNITGNAATATNASAVTNGVYTTGTYANPAWITSLSTSKIDLSTVTSAINAIAPIITSTAALQADINTRVLKAGDTMTGQLTNLSSMTVSGIVQANAFKIANGGKVLNFAASALQDASPYTYTWPQSVVSMGGASLHTEDNGVLYWEKDTNDVLVNSTQTITGQKTFLNQVTVSSNIVASGYVSASSYIGLPITSTAAIVSRLTAAEAWQSTGATRIGNIETNFISTGSTIGGRQITNFFASTTTTVRTWEISDTLDDSILSFASGPTIRKALASSDLLYQADNAHRFRNSDGSNTLNVVGNKVGISTGIPQFPLDVKGAANFQTIMSTSSCINGDCRTAWPGDTSPIVARLNALDAAISTAVFTANTNQTIDGSKTFSHLIYGQITGADAATTAGALSVAPTICAAGEAPRGITANGNATGCMTLGGGGDVYLANNQTFTGLNTFSNTTTLNGVIWGADLEASTRMISVSSITALSDISGNLTKGLSLHGTTGDTTAIRIHPAAPSVQISITGITTQVSSATFKSNVGVTGTLTAGGLSGPLTGNVTGDVTGNVSGNAGTVTNGLYTSTNFGGDVSGTYNAIKVPITSTATIVSALGNKLTAPATFYVVKPGEYLVAPASFSYLSNASAFLTAPATTYWVKASDYLVAPASFSYLSNASAFLVAPATFTYLRAPATFYMPTATDLSSKVAKTGDTMTGSLTVNVAGGQVIVRDTNGNRASIGMSASAIGYVSLADASGTGKVYQDAETGISSKLQITGSSVTSIGNLTAPGLCLGGDCRTSWPAGTITSTAAIMSQLNAATAFVSTMTQRSDAFQAFKSTGEAQIGALMAFRSTMTARSDAFQAFVATYVAGGFTTFNSDDFTANTNGSQVQFTLSLPPLGNSLMLTKNGVAMTAPGDYSLTNQLITMVTAPAASTVLVARYAVGVSTTLVSVAGGDAIGSLMMYSSTVSPAGYLYCDGSTVSRTGYAALFNVVGTKYGSGDGSTTFTLPDFRGMFARGAYGNLNSRDPDLNRVVGSTQTDTIQNHMHGNATAGYGVTADGGTYGVYAGGSSVAPGIGLIQPNYGYNVGPETRPENIAVAYHIKYAPTGQITVALSTTSTVLASNNSWAGSNVFGGATKFSVKFSSYTSIPCQVTNNQNTPVTAISTVTYIPQGDYVLVSYTGSWGNASLNGRMQLSVMVNGAVVQPSPMVMHHQSVGGYSSNLSFTSPPIPVTSGASTTFALVAWGGDGSTNSSCSWTAGHGTGTFGVMEAR